MNVVGSSYDNRWFSARDFFPLDELPSARVDAAIDRDPAEVAYAVVTGSLKLSEAQAVALLRTLPSFEGAAPAEVVVEAAASALDPEVFGEVFVETNPSWRPIASAMFSLPEGTARHYLSKYGTISATIAHHAYAAGYTLPASNIRRALSADSDVDPLLAGFHAMASEEMDPQIRAEALLSKVSELKYSKIEYVQLAMISALRSPEVSAHAAEMLTASHPAASDMMLRLAVLETPSPTVSAQLSQMATCFISEDSPDGPVAAPHEFFAVCSNYGLDSDVRSRMRQVAADTEVVSNPQWRPYSDEALDVVASALTAGRSAQLTPEFEEYRRPAKEKLLFFDARWPRVYREAVRFADETLKHSGSNLVRKWVQSVDLLSVFGPLAKPGLSTYDLGVIAPHESVAVSRMARDAGVDLELSTEWAFSDKPLSEDALPAEVRVKLRELLANDKARWSGFYDLLAEGLLPDEAALVVS